MRQIWPEGEIIIVCEHYRSDFASHLPDAIRSLIETYCRQGQDDSDRLLREGKCDRCNASWKLELREIEQTDICLLLTQWKDLGPGLDPYDERWVTHQSFTFSQRTLKASELLDDPRMRFEMQSNESGSFQALSEENMFLRNLSLLRRDRYRSVMRRWGPGWWWYLQGQEDKVKYSQCLVI